MKLRRPLSALIVSAITASLCAVPAHAQDAPEATAPLTPVVIILGVIAGAVFIAFMWIVWFGQQEKRRQSMGGLPQTTVPFQTPTANPSVNMPPLSTFSQTPHHQEAQPQAPVTGGETIYIAPDSGDTVFVSDETLSVLPPCFEVISGGAEEKSAVKQLYSLQGSNEFGIGRVDLNKSIANYIPIRSETASRDSSTQGKLVYDPQSNQCTIINLANPAEGKNPIRVNSMALSVAQRQTLMDGDTVQVGDVKLKFHANGV